MKKQDIEITVESVGRRGDGVGEWQGRPVFIPRALPGETVRVRLMQDQDKGIAAHLLNVLNNPNPQRTAPPCPHYDQCGGCALQHWTESAYRDWKETRVRDLLEKAGAAPDNWRAPVFIAASTRRRATLAAVLENGKLRLGYHRARSHDIADTPNCLILTPALAAVLQSMRPYLAQILLPNKPADIFVQDCGGIDIMITGAGKDPTLAQREAMADMAHACNLARISWRAREKDDPEIILQAAPLIKKSGNVSVALPPGAFLQPASEGEAALVAAVMAPLAGRKNIADLFAGCGTFTGPLLSLGKVRAVESDAPAVSALKKSGIDALVRNLYSDPLIPKELKDFDAVVIDPPRMGAIEQCRELAKSEVPLVVSVSCNPGTFVRDALELIAGGYHFESAQVIDQFVWSSHVELVGIFKK